MFQFHNGSIKSRRERLNYGSEYRFNSTMVRLKVYEDKQESLGLSGVSIPQWFD